MKEFMIKGRIDKNLSIEENIFKSSVKINKGGKVIGCLEGQEYILCAAIYFKDDVKREHQPKNIESGIVVCGRRHHNCFITLMQFLPKITRDDKIIQGFLTNKDKFVTREEAAEIAYKCKQINKEQKTLFSEDLW